MSKNATEKGNAHEVILRLNTRSTPWCRMQYIQRNRNEIKYYMGRIHVRRQGQMGNGMVKQYSDRRSTEMVEYQTGRRIVLFTLD